jgi:hypothetical protein
MTVPAPLLARWDGDAFQVAHRHRKQCDVSLTIGETYIIDVREQRSEAAHRAYFAAVNEAWRNLSEDKAERFRTPDHLRRFALIKTGFFDQRTVVCSSKAEARRLAAFIQPMDEYAIISAMEATVTVFTAKSQSIRAMGKLEFMRSQDAVRDYVASLLGVKPEALPGEEAA